MRVLVSARCLGSRGARLWLRKRAGRHNLHAAGDTAGAPLLHDSDSSEEVRSSTERSHLPQGDSLAMSSALDNSVMHTQVVNEYQVKSLVDAPCGALAWQPQMLEAIGKLQPDFRQASLRAQALLAHCTIHVGKDVGNLLSVK